MRTMTRTFAAASLGAAALLAAVEAPAQQDQGGPVPARVVATPAALTLQPGETAALQVAVYAEDGREMDVPVRFVGTLRGVAVNQETGTVRALTPGEHRVVAFVELPPGSALEPPRAEVRVTVPWPPVDRLEIVAGEGILYEGTVVEHRVVAAYDDGSRRPNPPVIWTSSNPEVAQVDRFGTVTGTGPGTVEITAEVEGVRRTLRQEVRPFPVARLEIEGGLPEARIGDVLRFRVTALDSDGNELPDVPVEWGYAFRPQETPFDGAQQPGAAGMVEGGRFVGEEPGHYRIFAAAGGVVARTSVELHPREAVRRVQLEGQGRVSHVHTSDFWPWEGVDGRDYAITGTWGADGYSYIWDITDPASPVLTDSVRVDARTVNDVKVSPDGRYATMTREGASNRRNGLVILDLADPAHPVIASEFDDGLTGGVHNAFPTNDHVFALSAGEKYLIIDVADLYAPRYVGEVQHGNCRIHDVWVLDGLAFSAQWACGIIVYDVGNGGWGGSPENPAFVSEFSTPGGRTHAVFPYRQESTGRLLVFAGDEIMSRPGRALEGGLQREPYDPETDRGGTPSHTDGYTHILDFTDMENPRKLARYRVPEYGTHNIWVEDDILYQAYYEGGARLVDVSGDLMGNLYRQGREIAVFKSYDPAGFIGNAPMVWSVMPFRGRVLFSDWNSGIWSVRLEPTQPLAM